ncbi:uncharacterized protein LOC118450315 [Vespa mandarinia]|uniref:uncharacterized protein LOC118450315 n=1 Tax=Vespa mandarinia TaxID=7446 RepID=UPI00161A5E84|nr:uncharacterized protein LOC118450315 [Vespa mandarinia]
MDLGPLNRVGCPTCVRPQGSSDIDLTWSTSAAGVRLSDWRVNEGESLSDHLYVRYSYRHEAAGVRNSRPQDKKLPRWKVNSLDEDYLAAAFISREWTGATMCGRSAAGADCVDKMVKWAQSTLKQACDMAMSRVRGQTRGSKSTYWWSDELTNLRTVATATVRKLSRAKKKKNSEEIVRCLDARRDVRRALIRAIKEVKKNSCRDLLDSIEEDPWDRPYKLVLGKLRPYAPPVTETMEDEVLKNILSKLFPGGPGTDEPQEPTLSEVTISVEEVLVAAWKGKGRKAPGLDGIPDVVVPDSVEGSGARPDQKEKGRAPGLTGII